MCSGSFALWLTLTGLTFLSLRHAAHGAPSAVSGNDSPYVFEIAADGFPRFALTVTAMRLEQPFAILHAPAHFVDLVIAYVVAQKPFWSPSAMGPAVWQCVTHPLFATPAWFFVGRGIDRLRKGVRTPRTIAIVGTVLVLLFAVFAAVLRFGLAHDPGLVPGRLEGFTLWTVLFAIPIFASLNWRSSQPI